MRALTGQVGLLGLDWIKAGPQMARVTSSLQCPTTSQFLPATYYPSHRHQHRQTTPSHLATEPSLFPQCTVADQESPRLPLNARLKVGMSPALHGLCLTAGKVGERGFSLLHAGMSRPAKRYVFSVVSH
jgi:hypothetical protein